MPTYHPDPTPAEAAKVPPPPKHRRGGKRVKGHGGDARPQAAPPAAVPPATSSPVRTSGSKRLQKDSPQTTPAKGTPAKGRHGASGDVDSIDLTPLKLEEKLALLEAKPTLTPYEVRHIVNDPEWKGQLWDHSDVGKMLLTKDDAHLFAEQQYDFVAGDTAPETATIVKLINIDKLKYELAKRALKCKNPEASTYHFNHGPFGLCGDNKNEDNFCVVNAAGKLVVSLDLNTFRLETAEFAFDREDATTYETLCRVKCNKLISCLRNFVNSGKEPYVTLSNPASGPFSFRRIDKATVGLYSQVGQVARISLASISGAEPSSAKADPPEEWVPA
jgi:hypothetical protein